MVLAAFTTFYLFAFNTNAQFQTSPQAPNQSGNSYVPDQLIVKFKEGYDPVQITNIVQKRNIQRQNLLGSIFFLFQNFQYKLKGQNTPEENLENLMKLQDKFFFSSKELLGQSEETDAKSTFLYTFEKPIDVEAAIRAYENLSIVEYAEPNYILDTF